MIGSSKDHRASQGSKGKNEGDRQDWDAKKGKIIVKSFYSFRKKRMVTFPLTTIWNLMVFHRSGFF